MVPNSLLMLLQRTGECLMSSVCVYWETKVNSRHKYHKSKRVEIFSTLLKSPMQENLRPNALWPFPNTFLWHQSEYGTQMPKMQQHGRYLNMPLGWFADLQSWALYLDMSPFIHRRFWRSQEKLHTRKPLIKIIQKSWSYSMFAMGWDFGEWTGFFLHQSALR